MPDLSYSAYRWTAISTGAPMPSSKGFVSA